MGIGFGVSAFELRIDLNVGIGLVIKQGIGERSANAFVKKRKEDGHANALFGQAIGVAATVTLDQAMRFELAHIITELTTGIGGGGEFERRENGLVNVGHGPTGELRTGMEQDFHEAQDSGVVDFDAGNLHGAGLNGQRQTLKDREVHVDVERGGLKMGEAVRYRIERGADGGQVVQGFFEMKIRQVVAADFLA